jgi:transposase-like protein
MHCIRCGGTECRKNGVNKGKQRYICKGCSYTFTNLHGRGKPPAVKLQALRLYTENVGLRSIARLLGVSPSTVMRWVQESGRQIMERMRATLPADIDGMDIIEIDEMWHYTQKKNANSGFGLLYLETPGASSPWKLVRVAQSLSKNSGQD